MAEKKTIFKLSLKNEEQKNKILSLAKQEGITASEYILRCVAFYQQSEAENKGFNANNSKDNYMVYMLNKLSEDHRQLLELYQTNMEIMQKNNEQLWGFLVEMPKFYWMGMKNSE